MNEQAVAEFDDLPLTACWRHVDSRAGFEVAYFAATGTDWLAQGTTTALQDEHTWIVTYRIELDSGWRTRSAHVTTETATDSWETVVEHATRGRWTVNGVAAPHLDGCLDIDLEASAMTNAFPIRRNPMAVGATMSVPAVYIRVASGVVERLEQEYTRRKDERTAQVYDYSAPAFDFRSRLVYGADGLVVGYPGIASRVLIAS